MKTNARFIKNIDSNRKLWQMPDGVYVQTSFSDKIEGSHETMAFEADANGEVVDWRELAVSARIRDRSSPNKTQPTSKVKENSEG
jgi:hypothetical protein